MGAINSFHERFISIINRTEVELHLRSRQILSERSDSGESACVPAPIDTIGMESRGKDQRGTEVVCNGYSLGLAFLHHQEINGEISVHQIWWHQSLSLPPESIVFSIVSSSGHKERWGACWAGAVRQIESVISNNMRPSSWETDCLNNSLCVCVSLVDECKAKREMEVWFQINKMTLMDG